VYQVSFTKAAAKEFKRLPNDIKKQIGEIFDQCVNNPFIIDCKKLKKPLAGYRILSGNYRILCTITDHQIDVYSVAHRKNAYRQ